MKNPRFSKKPQSVILAIVAGLACAAENSHAATITAADLDYAISDVSSNSFSLDFSGEPVWSAGSQRSTNGSADPNNRRAGRVFVDFQLDSATITAAGGIGASVSFTFDVLSIGNGVSGTPYTDGLDLRFLGTSANDRDAVTLWSVPGIAYQEDILGTDGATGSHTISLTDSSVLSLIASATPGDYISFGLSNTVGVTADPVGNSLEETYAFQMNTSPSSYSLSVIPEPAVSTLVGFGALALLRRRRSA